MTYISFYKFIFVIELYVAEFLFMFPLKKRKLYPLRLAFGAVVLSGMAAIPIPTNTFYMSCIVFLLLFGLSLPILWFCYDEPFANVLFCGMASYTCQHFAYEFTNLAMSAVSWGVSPLLGMYSNDIINFKALDKTAVFSVTLYLMCYLLSYWLMYALFGKRIKRNADMKIKSYVLLALVGAGLVTDIVISSVITYFLADNILGAAVNYITNMLCCLLLLAFQFNQLITKEALHELDIVRRMWQKDKEQYRVSRDNVDLINVKCHDMRHKVRSFMRDKQLSDEEISEIESSISIYDSAVKTGNEALDVILTEKSLQCTGNDIRFTCVADGAALAFMSESDIYSLFGNILDNAIEAALKIAENDGRTVGIKINRVGRFISINAKNTYSGEIEFDDSGLPVTTKADKDYHGYGIKSISYLVEKYGGNLSIVAKNGIFDLNLLFPIDLITEYELKSTE